MSVSNFNELNAHLGHKIVCVKYGLINICLECDTCNEVLISMDKGE